MKTDSTVLIDGLLWEFNTLKAMTQIYCRAHHPSPHPCNECRAFLEYAEQRLDRCPYGQGKPSCKHCPIHCYTPAPKLQSITIMRYAGPRMLWRHPIYTLRHLWVNRRQVPARPDKGLSNYAQRKQQAIDKASD